MTPRATAASKQNTSSKTSPFELIAERELEEEKRLHDVLEALKKEEAEAEKGMNDAGKHEEDALREEAKKSLAESKEAIGKELAASEKNVSKELEKIEALYKERAPEVIQEQVKELLTLAD